jgi:hypothetical protein
MTKFRDIELPEGIIKVFQQIVLDSDADKILVYAEFRDKNLIKGLRPIKENAERIKQRLMTQLGAKKTISKDEIFFLSRNNPFSFLDGLEEQTILTNLDELCSVVGADRIMAYLLLSDRAELQMLAKSMVLGERAVKALSEEETKIFTVNTMQAYLPFFVALQNALSEGEGDKGVADPPKFTGSVDENPLVVQLKNQVSLLTDQLNEARKDGKQHKQVAAQAEDLKRKLVRYEKMLTELKEDIAGLKSLVAEKNKELDQLQAAIADQVDEEVGSVLHSWLRAPRDMHKELTQRTATDLLGRADWLIKKQQEIDRHSGNRAALSLRLRSVQDARLELSGLCRDSLSPLPELGIMLKELVQEESSLQQLLGQSHPDSDFIQNFMAKIGVAGSPDEVVRYKSLLETLNDAGILEHSAVRDLLVYCDQRLDLAYDKYVPDVKNPEPVRDSFRMLKEAIHNNKEIIWFLDGHNILFELSEMFGTLDSAGKPSESSRLSLSDALVSLVSGADQCQVRLYFDGPTRSEYSPAANVKVIYSGGQGDHRADAAICSDMSYLCGKAGSVPFFITTNDRALREEASSLCAKSLRVDDFYILLRIAGIRPLPK